MNGAGISEILQVCVSVNKSEASKANERDELISLLGSSQGGQR